MARGFATVSDISITEGQFVHAASGRHYEVVRRGGQVFQRRFEVDANGNQFHAYELEATHVVGSGNHARTFLHRSDIGEFTELPLTWYSQEQRWAMSPGFDHAKPADFTRMVDDRCLFCHNGYPTADGKLANGIDCQRCHGPGSRHFELASNGKATKQEIAAAIVNPARLGSDRRLEVCMQCHLETTSSSLPSMLRRFDRAVHSFRPGEPLGAYAVYFDEQETSRAEKFEIVNQAYRLRQSACFLKSGGALTCTTCHNPHAVDHGEAAKADYRAKCKTCHPTIAAAKHPDLETSDCIGCHMPERRSEDAVHVVMTDHRIQRKTPTGDLKRARSEDHGRAIGTPVLYYPAQVSDHDLYLGVALVANGAARIRGIELLERQLRPDTPPKALAVLGQAYLEVGKPEKAIPILQQALERDPALTRTRYNLAQALEMTHNLEAARGQYDETLRLQPQFPEAEYAWANLLRNTGDRSAAIDHYKTALRLRPNFPEAQGNMGVLAGDSGAVEDALKIDPNLEDAYVNLAMLSAAHGKSVEALQYIRRATAMNPRNPIAQYNLGRLLQQSGNTRDAIAAYKRAIELRPTFVEAHLSLGQLYGDAGQITPAIAEFKEVLRLQPGNRVAQQNLDLALSMGGRK